MRGRAWLVGGMQSAPKAAVTSFVPWRLVTVCATVVEYSCLGVRPRQVGAGSPPRWTTPSLCQSGGTHGTRAVKERPDTVKHRSEADGEAAKTPSNGHLPGNTGGPEWGRVQTA